MSRRRIKIDNFGTELQKILDDYGQNVTEKTRAAVLEAAKVAVPSAAIVAIA